jgi:glycosyltransferase involved in cell wall biosynthesis
MEQMMRGRPVIVADIGGLAEVVGSAGLKFAIGGVSELAARMRDLLDDPALAARLGQLARERAASLFGLNRMIREHVELLKEVSGA